MPLLHENGPPQLTLTEEQDTSLIDALALENQFIRKKLGNKDLWAGQKRTAPKFVEQVASISHALSKSQKDACAAIMRSGCHPRQVEKACEVEHTGDSFDETATNILPSASKKSAR